MKHVNFEWTKPNNNVPSVTDTTSNVSSNDYQDDKIIKNIWLIDRLLFYVPLANISLTNRKLAIADDKLQTGIICSALMTLRLYSVADRALLLWHETSVLYGFIPRSASFRRLLLLIRNT